MQEASVAAILYRLMEDVNCVVCWERNEGTKRDRIEWRGRERIREQRGTMEEERSEGLGEESSRPNYVHVQPCPPTCSPTSWGRVCRDDPREPERTEVHTKLVVIVLC